VSDLFVARRVAHSAKNTNKRAHDSLSSVAIRASQLQASRRTKLDGQSAKRTGQTHWPNALAKRTAKRTGQTHWPNALPNALAKRTGQLDIRAKHVFFDCFYLMLQALHGKQCHR